MLGDEKAPPLPRWKVQQCGGDLRHREGGVLGWGGCEGLLQVGCSKPVCALLGCRGLGLSRLQNLLSNQKGSDVENGEGHYYCRKDRGGRDGGGGGGVRLKRRERSLQCHPPVFDHRTIGKSQRPLTATRFSPAPTSVSLTFNKKVLVFLTLFSFRTKCVLI